MANGLARPKPIAIACVVVLTALGWSACGLIPASDWPTAFCRPSLGGGFWPVDFGLAFAMWAAMTLAMMLPTASPMILTYAEIADTAASKSELVAAPVALILGYAAVWLGFALAAALLQLLTARLALVDGAKYAQSLTAACLLAAGLYQFSSLKQACLHLCQRPFPFFFSNWTAEPRGVFKLGLRQGLYCLGCCWALMLVMLALGVMNVVWMAGLGALMTIEKMSTSGRFARGLGLVLIAAGIVMVTWEMV